MSPLFYLVIALGFAAAVFLVWLLTDWVLRKIAQRRELRAIRTRKSRRERGFIT